MEGVGKMILRARTADLFNSDKINGFRKNNSETNMKELELGRLILDSYPRRLVFELTNLCNLNCIMCGRNDSYFEPTVFDVNWIDKLQDALEHIEEVTLMGWGEPTVHPKFTEILERLDRHGVRKYFCTNGMRLEELREAIFKHKVDIIAVSVDGADAETNNSIREGSDFNRIISSLKSIVEEKRSKNLNHPYMNFVFTAMRSNFHQIPDMVRLAHEVGMEEVKVVYLTAFSGRMLDETLYNCQDEVKSIFDKAERLSEELGIKLKLPHLQGEDIAGAKPHKDCYAAWRDLFLGSDGYIRPCMSTPIKMFNVNDYKNFADMWNSKEYADFRRWVNNDEGMPVSCKTCYQSSYANWNNMSSFIQIGNDFSPEWGSEAAVSKE